MQQEVIFGWRAPFFFLKTCIIVFTHSYGQVCDFPTEKYLHNLARLS